MSSEVFSEGLCICFAQRCGCSPTITVFRPMCLPRVVVFIEIVFFENQGVFRWPWWQLSAEQLEATLDIDEPGSELVDVAEGAQIFLPPLTRVIAPS